MDATSALPTIGVEEELLLLDPGTGRPLPVAAAVLDRLAGRPGPRAELMRYQIEAATGVCRDLAEVSDQLWRMRRDLAVAAAEEGSRLVACGVTPYSNPGLAFLTDDPRYLELARRYPVETAMSGTCACHVHVAVPSREAGVRVLDAVRPWLATFLAASVNSAISSGRASGWHSRRFALLSRWPTARPPRRWSDSAGYDATVRELIATGAALDERAVYFLTRLSPRYPTVEVRVPDVCPDIDTALLLAALIRALVVTALGAAVRYRSGGLEEDLTTAAHTGLGAIGTDPRTGRRVPQYRLLDGLRSYVDDALAELGDRAVADRSLRLLSERGTGAERQLRQWYSNASPSAFVRELARTTLTAPMASPAWA
ncbi:YbdK family carboxylate-amine ligase [Actinoplanes sp. NPDC049265]|uniref:carboxylate-amine ligase n=1 Tax=Actinoplanes sp. NPDC049265 TaxID=3363902 RepID=UPI00371CAFCA